MQNNKLGLVPAPEKKKNPITHLYANSSFTEHICVTVHKL